MGVHEFQSRWLIRFGLPQAGWSKAVRSELAARPFADATNAQSLIQFLFQTLPGILERESGADTARLAEAYAWTCFAFWQCGSAFPSFPENYALHLRDQLMKPAAKRSPEARLLADLILGADAETKDSCGFNRLALARPEVVRDSEQLIHEGRYEDFLKAGEKYAEYENALAESAEFQSDWQQLKARYRKQAVSKTIIYRTLIPERNWVRGEGARFTTSAERFQSVFDLFCWKYYLWGMKGDAPLLLKASVVFTPLGTQIFIPGYLSFDPKRDLDFGKITKLHRARGIARQGPGFSAGRSELAEKRKQTQAADREARKAGLKGEARYAFVCERIGFRDSGDYRRLRKLLSPVSPSSKP